MATKLYFIVVTAVAALGDHLRRDRAQSARESGISTLEVVVIALGLFILAGALVAAITAAVNSRIGKIN